MVVSSEGQENQNIAGYIENEFVVGLAPQLSIDEFSARVRALSGEDGSIIDTFPRINAVALKLSDIDAGQASLQNLISSSPDVRYIEPNYIYSAIPNALTNDNHLDDLWYFSEDIIGTPVGWPLSPDASNIVIAVVDTGVHYNHKDLKGNIWRNSGEIEGNGIDDDGNGYIDDTFGWDFYNQDNDPNADLVPEMILGLFEHPTKKIYENHGTHVACTIVCIANNSEGIAGIAPTAKVMPLKFLGGGGGSGELTNALRAITYAVENGAHIINNSWGGGPFSEALKEALFDAHRSGVLVVAASGNGGSDQIGDDNDVAPHYPSSYNVPSLISVAASNKSDTLTSFSNFGRLSVDIAAPGNSILSAVPLGDETSSEAEDGYDSLDGTSMATPIVSGVVANIMAKFPNLTHNEVRNRLFQTADKKAGLESRIGQGARINFRAALAIPELSPDVLGLISNLSAEERSIALTTFENLSESEKVRVLNRPFSSSQKRRFLKHALEGTSKSFIATWEERLTEEQKKALLSIYGEVEIISPVSRRKNIDEIIVRPKVKSSDTDALIKGIPELRSLEPNQTIRLK